MADIYFTGIMTLEQISEIEAKLNYSFVDKKLLVRAFTHSSYVNAKRGSNQLIDSNERMAFFGDAILGMIVSQYLYEAFPEINKGEMSYMRSRLVSSNAIAPVLDLLDLKKYLRFLTNSQPSEHLCGDLYEAIVCAIYLDGGFEPAKQFVLASLSELLDSVGDTIQKDCKTLLQEYCQRHNKDIPEYRQAQKSGSDNDPIYKCDLYIKGNYMCSGVGHSKKSAEQDAAKKIVTKWRIDSALS